MYRLFLTSLIINQVFSNEILSSIDLVIRWKNDQKIMILRRHFTLQINPFEEKMIDILSFTFTIFYSYRRYWVLHNIEYYEISIIIFKQHNKDTRELIYFDFSYTIITFALVLFAYSYQRFRGLTLNCHVLFMVITFCV